MSSPLQLQLSCLLKERSFPHATTERYAWRTSVHRFANRRSFGATTIRRGLQKGDRFFGFSFENIVESPWRGGEGDTMPFVFSDLRVDLYVGAHGLG
jgi:hypothetical protein